MGGVNRIGGVGGIDKTVDVGGVGGIDKIVSMGGV